MIVPDAANFGHHPRSRRVRRFRATAVPGVGNLQFHFHTPSEHRLNGEEYAIEMHLVHQSSAGQLLVVAVLIESDDANKELREIFRDLPDEGETNTVERFDLRKLFPAGEVESYRYEGSLTTPPFTEGVYWIVLDETLEMSSGQIDAFQDLFPDGNSRELEPLNGRQIVSDD